MQRADSNTLVLITSDHETGGMSITKGNRDGSELELSYSSGSHTPSPVGIFAFGPGEELFKGIMNINILDKNFSNYSILPIKF